MELKGENRIPAPRERVWEALHDPEILKACITGCESLEMADDGTMKAKVTAKVGPVKATFNADVQILNSVPPEGYTLQGEGKGGVAGFAKGSADVALAAEGDETVLSYHAKANVGGKLAQLGSRLVDSTAKRYAADFFTKFSEIVGGGAAPDAVAEAPAAAPEPAVEAAVEPVPAPEPVTEPAPQPAAAPEPALSEPIKQMGSVPPTSSTTTPAPAAAPIAPTAAPATPPAPAPAGGSRRMWLWGGIAIIALAIIILAAS